MKQELLTINPELLAPLQLPLVNKFYKQNRARGKAKGNETVWVVKYCGSIIAAARIADISGHDFLTGVQVAQEFQRQGIAGKLIGEMLKGRQKPVYTFPYQYLVSMYKRLGFELCTPEELPKPLQQRFERYQAQGRDITAAVYPCLV